MYKTMLLKGVNIKIIGDSLAAGAGSSDSYKTQELIFQEEGKNYYKRVAPNSWWGLLEKHLKTFYNKSNLVNKGCGGAFTYQIKKHLNDLVTLEDDLVFILMGVNDRKRIKGMEELKDNCFNIIDELLKAGKQVVLLTPTPSVHSNEYYENRIFHTPDVVKILRDISANKGIILVDNYKYLMDYLQEKQLLLEDIIYGEGCKNDGLHPSDLVQKLMFENLVETLQI